MGNFSKERMTELFSRILMIHRESDALFVTTTEEEFLSALDQGCDDVTGIPEFENKYKEQSDRLDAAAQELVSDELPGVVADLDTAEDAYSEAYQEGLLEKQREAQRDMEMWGDA